MTDYSWLIWIPIYLGLGLAVGCIIHGFNKLFSRYKDHGDSNA